MQIIYEIAIRLYGILIQIASLFSQKAKLWTQGRKQLWNTFPTMNNRAVYWFHCASLGEFDQALPVMNLWRKQFPDAFILVTFFSPSGFLYYHKRKHPADFVTYIPLDTKRNARKFVTYFRPTMAFFVKYEFWHNHIFALKQKKTQIYSISTVLRPSQVYFKWYGRFFRKILSRFDCFFVQNQSTLSLLESIGVKKVILSGDTRFDRVIENKRLLIENPILEKFIQQGETVFIAGSTWTEDEKILGTLINGTIFDRYIIAPHNVDDLHIQAIEARWQHQSVRYSQFKKDATAKVLIIDSIGQLASAYAYAHVAYVGGGFSGALHNILEPAVFGLPVIFGPKFSRFPEAQSFIDQGIGYSVDTQEALLTTVKKVLSERQMISEKSLRFVEHNKGAAQKIIHYFQRHSEAFGGIRLFLLCYLVN